MGEISNKDWAPAGLSDWRRLIAVPKGNFDINDLEQLKWLASEPSLRKDLKPSISNKLQGVKDALVQDPYNLALITKLGLMYAEESRWDMAANTLVRGWKRMTEIANPEVRHHYLMTLAVASYTCGKYLQTEAVLNDVEEPKAADDFKRYWVLMARVAGRKKDTRKVLKAFTTLREGQGFNGALGLIVALHKYLKMAGAYEAAVGATKALAQHETDGMRLDATVESLASKPGDEEPWYVKFLGEPRNVIISGSILGAIIFIYFLYWLETMNLQRLKIKGEL
mmetsp:Transcript_54238/g.100245  ORF Transcript_54238/g.100245 Transcript_54238/m.100245 type:complete len:281 (-) Transcript_54238:72-914(-)